MDDPRMRSVMGACGRHRIETALAWRYSVPNLLEVYRKVLPSAILARQPAISEAELRTQAVSCGRST
jgi:hypothetical protein